jgi:NTP pyrophosphatase (non-canonical NTP hydrolase)
MEEITSENYVENCLRTNSIVTEEFMGRLSDPKNIQLLHACLGMTTEVGEFTDMLKKHLFYGKAFDFPNAIEELGDTAWYVAIAIDALRTTLNEVMTINIEKLRKRYPEKFTEDLAINRDADKEREFLECVSREITPSIRGMNAYKFFREVIDHIDNYVVPQYGDSPDDPAEEWSSEECMKQLDKYIKRFKKNSREGQQELDFLKMAHYIQLAAEKYSQGK